MQEKLKDFFMKSPPQTLSLITEYIDYKSLYRDILTTDNEHNLPKPLNEILTYKELYGDERTFRKLGFDYDNLGVDLKKYIDYDLYTKDFINIYQVEDKDIPYLINEGDGPELFEELDASVKEIPKLQTMEGMTSHRVKEKEETNIDELEYIDEDEYEEMPDDFLDEYR